MIRHYNELLDKILSGEEDTVYLKAQGEEVIQVYGDEIKGIMDLYDQRNHDFKAVQDMLKNLADRAKLSIYIVNFIFLAIRSEYMLEDYRKAGYSDDLFWDTITDLSYKLEECKQVKGVPGNFVPWWYGIFFELKLFKIGRLEYEISTYEGPTWAVEGHEVAEGDRVFSVHIPSGEPLTKEVLWDSYHRAHGFFREAIGEGPMVCYCHSWLMSPLLKDIFHEGSNILGFLEDWHILAHETCDVFEDAWRIFGADYTGDVGALPQETSIQKAMAAYLAKGKKTGMGKGILLIRESN